MKLTWNVGEHIFIEKNRKPWWLCCIHGGHKFICPFDLTDCNHNYGLGIFEMNTSSRFCCFCLNCHKANNTLQRHTVCCVFFSPLLLRFLLSYSRWKPQAEIPDANIINIDETRCGEIYIHGGWSLLYGLCVYWRLSSLVFFLQNKMCSIRNGTIWFI